VTCPHCGKKNECQSKAGHCSLDHFDETDVPAVIAVDLTIGSVSCEHCRGIFKIKAEMPDTCRVRGVIPKKDLVSRAYEDD
jgi:hypothetical protein